MKKTLLMMTAVLALFSFILIGNSVDRAGTGGGMTTQEHGVEF